MRKCIDIGNIYILTYINKYIYKHPPPTVFLSHPFPPFSFPNSVNTGILMAGCCCEHSSPPPRPKSPPPPWGCVISISTPSMTFFPFAGGLDAFSTGTNTLLVNYSLSSLPPSKISVKSRQAKGGGEGKGEQTHSSGVGVGQCVPSPQRWWYKYG